jgi:16S rRNA (cytosine1402-N4)-methyltransferase
MPEFHKPVLLSETISLLAPKPGSIFVDATLGGGGHAAELLERTAPDGVLIGLDRDPEAIEFSRKRLAAYGERARLYQGNHRDTESILRTAGIERIDGAIFDLGVSSHELESGRGFSFQLDERLDMRMDPTEDTPNAADIVNDLGESELSALISSYGEERYARRVARAIVDRRRRGAIATTGELVDVILSAVGSRYRGQDIHPATRTFQAIRIAVNRELESAEAGIIAAIEALAVSARICVISFHSLEDRIAKTVFRRLSGRCECARNMPECRCGAREILRVLTRKPMTPSAEEIADNPRSRSAKLRCAERIGP